MLQDELTNWENLSLAWQKAARGKRGKPEVAKFEWLLADHLLELQSELRQQTYTPGAYHSFTIHEPKRRLISAAPFRDRVVHHALCNLTVPHFERRFIPTSFANRVGKGTHHALDACQQFARRYAYVLACDVVQFFPSIDHQILQTTLSRMLPDSSVNWLIARILAGGAGVLSESYDMKYFPGDDLFAYLRPRGLPIGNLTSQWWANVYLNPFDQFVKRELRCKAYVRYVDDFLLFADDKATLWQWRAALIERLARFRLIIHAQTAFPQPVTRGIPFLGFVVYPQRRNLKRRKAIFYERKLRNLLRHVPREQIKHSLQGWVNHVRYGNTVGLRKSMFARLGILEETAHG